MLVLTRKEGERILIGENVTVTVVRIAGGVVRIGVEAPAEVAIMRQEIKDQIDAANDARSSPPELT
jgi:carbon storage regulator